MKSAWQLYKEKNGVTPLDALNPATKMADDETANKRYDVCKSCDFFVKMTHQCKKCGCFMNLKTKLEAAKCPIEKW